MPRRLLIITCLGLALCGCATDNQPSGAAPQSSSSRTGDYRTGSRLPSYDPPGTAASREVSRDDWIDERRTGGNQGSVR